MLESICKAYWTPEEAVKKKLAVDYAVSVVEKGVTCCEHTCNNPLLNQISRNNQDRMIKKARIILMMLLAGIHVEDDLMGADDSWRTMLEDMGIAVDCPTIEYNNTTYYKGLAFREKCIDFFTDRLTRALNILTYY